MVQAIANEKHFQPGWVSHMYKARWGEWPSGRAGQAVAQMTPTDEVRAEIEERIREYRKAQRAAKKAAGSSLRR
jgi:hypothetical protein